METILDIGARIPSRAHEHDAGYDLYSREEMVVPANGSAIFDTGVHMAIPKGMAGILVSKSGLNIKSDITSTGLIDSGYAGAIKVKLYNHGDKPYTVYAGDKISQIVIVPVFTPSLETVNEFSEKGERGNNGFGSSGR